jgi:hypothetical protein
LASIIETEMKQNNKVELTICPNWVVKSDNNHKGGVDHHHKMAFLLETMSELTTMVKIRNVLWSSQKLWWTCHSSLQ